MSERNRSKDPVSKEKIPVKEIPRDDRSKNTAQRTKKATTERSEKSNAPTRRAGVGGRIWIVLWMLLCAVLLLRIWDLNHTIDTLKTRIDKLTRIVAQQRDRMEQLADALQTEQKDTDQHSQSTGSGAANGQKTDSQGSAQAGQQDSSAQEDSPEEATAVSGQGVAHKVYLTFDDGPSAYTQDILDILEEYGVKATFFIVGREGAQAKDMVCKIAEAGHTLGMHSYTHDYDEIYASVENFAADFEKIQDFLYEVTGEESRVYRFPGGSSNTVSDIDMSEFAKYLDSQGVRFFDWNISSGDGGSFLVPVETLIENCTGTIRNHETSVVLMHDVAGKTTTREALPTIIETIQAMDDTVLLPITDDTALIQHIEWDPVPKKNKDKVRK